MRRDLADDLRAILDAQDGRTLIQMREAEPHYDVTVDTAKFDGKGTTVSFAGGLTTYLRREIGAGDILTIWDGSDRPTLGRERHGWAHNGELIEWLTPFERIAKRVAWLAEHDRSRRERLEQGAEKRSSEYAALPGPLRARIDRFVDANPDFWLNGDYELFCCTEAARIVDQLRPSVEAGEDASAVIAAFRAKPWDEQREVISDQHSGNTLDGSCALALALLEGRPV